MIKQPVNYNDNTAKLFTLIQYKINFNLTNNSNVILPTDILRDQIKFDLFNIATTTIENSIYKVNKSRESSFESKSLLTKLIKTTTENFLLKYYGYKVQINSAVLAKSSYIKNVLDDSRLLIDIPLSCVVPLHKKRHGKIEATFLPIYEELTDSFIEALFENLIIQICCAVMTIILNEFALVSTIRQYLFKSNFLSFQQVEGFKNNIAWQAAIKKYIERPKNIYGSQYCLWVLRKEGIINQWIYSNQYPELLNLSESSLLIITYTELKDFLKIRFNEIIYKVGEVIRYSLTTLLGKSVGLIWRGILDGLK